MKYLKMKWILAFAACYAVFISCLLSIYVETNQHQSNIEAAYQQEQQTLTEQTAVAARLVLSETGDQTALENRVVSDILKQSDISDDRFFIFAVNNAVLYLRNDTVTEQMQGQTVKQAFERFRSSSGNMTELYSALDAKVSATVAFTFSADHEKQFISLSYFTIGGHQYLVAICTSENYVILRDQMQAHNLTIYLFTVFLSLLFFGISIFYVLNLIHSERDKKTLKKTLCSKNLQIQHLTNKIQVAFRDEQTGVYNQQFFQQLLSKIHKKKLLPVSIAVMSIKPAEFADVDRMMQIVSDVLIEFVTADCAIARTDNNEFTFLMLSTPIFRAKTQIRAIETQLELQNIRVDFGIAQLSSMKQRAEEVYQKAHSLMYYRTLED